MGRQEILERERRLRTLVAIASVLPLPLLIGAAVAQSSGTRSDLTTETLRSINENSGALLGGAILGGFAFLLLAVPLVYLFRAAQARSERMLGGLVFLAILGPVMFAAQGILLAVSQIDVAEQFVAQEGGVGDIYSLATNLLEDSGTRSAALAVSSLALLAMIFAMVYTPLWAMRTGLLTRTHATLGMALGVSFILPPLTQITLPALLAWFMYFGLLILGRTPKGRPPAWEAAEAIPWSKPGEEEPEPRSAAEVIEGDASEIPGVDPSEGENPNAARRDRAKKRKRKRRR
ncbi:hypothetical protein BH24ACT23_BH24ACT23_11980 [soil metagenome]